jgi:hypothetical protein
MGAPALLDAQAGQVLARLNAAIEFLRNHVSGGIVTDGGTTQASGAGTALNFDVDVAALSGVAGGVPFVEAAATDVDSDAGISFGATSGKSVVYRLVTDGATYTAVPGDVADTGDEEPPADADVTTAVGTAQWAIVADVTVDRTADTSVTVTVDHSVRGNLASYLTDLATTEADYQMT